VQLIRDGRPITVTAELGELAPAVAAATREATEETERQLDPAFDGAELVDNGSGATTGVLVARVAAGSPAAERGLRAGDVITKINRVRVRNLMEAAQITQNARSIILEVQRGNRNQLILMR
jgi:S1-C subfamily serine protease